MDTNFFLNYSMPKEKFIVHLNDQIFSGRKLLSDLLLKLSQEYIGRRSKTFSFDIFLFVKNEYLKWETYIHELLKRCIIDTKKVEEFLKFKEFKTFEEYIKSKYVIESSSDSVDENIINDYKENINEKISKLESLKIIIDKLELSEDKTNAKINENLHMLTDKLSEICIQAEDDKNKKNWGTYDIHIKEYNKVKEELQKYSPIISWLSELPSILTVPSGDRGGGLAFGESITGMGTAPEKAKYSEIITLLKPYVNQLKKYLSEKEKLKVKTKQINGKPKVFIVHGHDHEMVNQIKDFITHDMKMDPIVMKDEVNKGRTIPEKFEQYADQSDYAIILMTPDDDLTNNTDKTKIFRARQNVILELGYFWAKFSRSKFAVIKKGSFESPSDIQGVIYLPFEKNVKEILYDLRKEILAALEIN